MFCDIVLQELFPKIFDSKLDNSKSELLILLIPIKRGFLPKLKKLFRAIPYVYILIQIRSADACKAVNRIEDILWEVNVSESKGVIKWFSKNNNDDPSEYKE